MHPKSSAVQTADADLDVFNHEPCGHPVNAAALVLEELPNGESAWLRPAVDRRYARVNRTVGGATGKMAAGATMAQWPSRPRTPSLWFTSCASSYAASAR